MLGTFWHRSEMIRRTEKKKGLKNVFEKGKRKRGREIRSQEIGVNFFCVDFWMIPLYWLKQRETKEPLDEGKGEE